MKFSISTHKRFKLLLSWRWQKL